MAFDQGTPPERPRPDGSTPGIAYRWKFEDLKDVLQKRRRGYGWAPYVMAGIVIAAWINALVVLFR